MHGSGFIEMLSRQITADLRHLRDGLAPGGSVALVSKGISFGTLKRTPDGAWDTSEVTGLGAVSLSSTGAAAPPDLVVRPFHQAGRVVSLREFTNNAFNHHHGIQSSERFGAGTDPDGDGFPNELTRADVTATTVFQATLPVPGQLIPRDAAFRAAVAAGAREFTAIGCASCHIPALPLTNNGWIFTEPNPYNPPGNLQVGQAPTLSVDLTSDRLPPPRLKKRNGVVMVPAYTDLKLHDICGDGPSPNREPLDMQQPAGSVPFFAGNCKFITKKLWGAANEMPFGHHGQFTTLREAIIWHHGEAEASRAAFEAFSETERRNLIEFLKTLQVLPPGTRNLVVTR